MKFEATRTAGLEKLAKFLPKSASDYASKRNYDLPDQNHPHVSGLSPYLRHRMISEQEVLQSVLARYSYSSAEKFIQEVYWRTYWKGWLEQRPEVWDRYQAELSAAINRLQSEAGLREQFDSACLGETDLSYFNNWSQELVNTGYLHNHARMWFASIWIFTLGLPWQLGADFFLRHLIDGDPASNTLSWKWVAGLQTVGKTYLARPDNISKYTENRYAPKHSELATDAPALSGAAHPERRAIPASDEIPSEGRVGFLMTEDDLNPSFLIRQKLTPAATAILKATNLRSPLAVSDVVHRFVDTAIEDTRSRLTGYFGEIGTIDTVSKDGIAAWIKQHSLDLVVVPYVPAGPSRQALETAGIKTYQIMSKYDQNAWPHASAGFFKFRKEIPKLINQFK